MLMTIKLTALAELLQPVNTLSSMIIVYCCASLYLKAHISP